MLLTQDLRDLSTSSIVADVVLNLCARPQSGLRSDAYAGRAVAAQVVPVAVVGEVSYLTASGARR